LIDIVKKFFSKGLPDNLDKKNKKEGHDIRVATCALLLEMAYIDKEFSKDEQDEIVSIIKEEYQLPDKQIDELVEAAHEELEGKVDLWQFASLINKNYSYEEKIGIIEMLWKVVYADKKLDKYEDYLVHKVANLLHLPHRILIDGKLKALRKSEADPSQP
jgi:uncharacterized tellurite resistance protein B-like protein